MVTNLQKKTPIRKKLRKKLGKKHEKPSLFTCTSFRYTVEDMICQYMPCFFVPVGFTTRQILHSKVLKWFIRDILKWHLGGVFTWKTVWIRKLRNSCALASVCYPLVNIQKAMERSTIFNGKFHYKLPFSIAMLVHQRVTQTWFVGKSSVSWTMIAPGVVNGKCPSHLWSHRRIHHHLVPWLLPSSKSILSFLCHHYHHCYQFFNHVSGFLSVIIIMCSDDIPWLNIKHHIWTMIRISSNHDSFSHISHDSFAFAWSPRHIWSIEPLPNDFRQL